VPPAEDDDSKGGGKHDSLHESNLGSPHKGYESKRQGGSKGSGPGSELRFEFTVVFLEGPPLVCSVGERSDRDRWVLKLLAAATQPDSAQETASTFLTRSAQNLNSLKKVFSSQANLASPENIISSRGDAFSFPKTTEKTSAERRSGQASSSPEPIAGLRYGGERGVRYEGEVGKRGQLNRAFQPRYFVIQDEAVAYYKDQLVFASGLKPQGVIACKDLKVKAASGKDGFEGFAFILSSHHSGKQIICSVPTPRERASWVSQLQAASTRALDMVPSKDTAPVGASRPKTPHTSGHASDGDEHQYEHQSPMKHEQQSPMHHLHHTHQSHMKHSPQYHSPQPTIQHSPPTKPTLPQRMVTERVRKGKEGMRKGKEGVRKVTEASPRLDTQTHSQALPHTQHTHSRKPLPAPPSTLQEEINLAI